MTEKLKGNGADVSERADGVCACGGGETWQYNESLHQPCLWEGAPLILQAPSPPSGPLGLLLCLPQANGRESIGLINAHIKARGGIYIPPKQRIYVPGEKKAP